MQNSQLISQILIPLHKDENTGEDTSSDETEAVSKIQRSTSEAMDVDDPEGDKAISDEAGQDPSSLR